MTIVTVMTDLTNPAQLRVVMGLSTVSINTLKVATYNPVSGQNLAQLSELTRFEMLFVLPRVSTSKKIWVDNFLCGFKPVTTPFLKRGKISTKIVEICSYYWIEFSKWLFMLPIV